MLRINIFKNIKIILIILCFSCSSINVNKNTGKLSLIISKNSVKNFRMIQKIKSELLFTEFIKDVEVEGEPSPVIIFDLNKQRLLNLNLTYDIVFNEIKNEFRDPFPIYPNKEKFLVIIKKSEFEKLLKYKQISDFGEILITNKNGNSIRLKNIAIIKLQLIENEILYKNEPVYIINVNYNKLKYKEIIKKLEKIKSKYKILFIVKFK